MTSSDNAARDTVDVVHRPYVLYLAMLSIGMGQTVIYAVMPALGRELGLDAIVVSFPLIDFAWQPGKLAITSLSAMTALVFALVAPFWGRYSDNKGRKPVILLGLLGYTFGTLLFNVVAYLGFSGVISGALLWFLLILARVGHASIMSATFPASNAYIVDITPLADRAKGLGRMSAANQLGVLMGPVMAAAVAFGFLTPLYIQAVLTLMAAGLVYKYLLDLGPQVDEPVRRGAAPESSGAKETIEEELVDPEAALELAENLTESAGEVSSVRPDAHTKKTSVKLSIWDPRFRFIIPVGFLMFTMQGMVQQVLGFYCEDVIGMPRMESVKYYATAMMASSIAMLFAQLLIVQRTSLSPTQLMRTGLPFCAIGYAVIGFTGTIEGMLLGMMIFGFGVGMAMPGYSATASYTVTPREQGSMAGITGSIAGMGFVFGPLIGGAIYNWSLNAPLFVAAGSLALLALYVVKNPRFQSVIPTAVD